MLISITDLDFRSVWLSLPLSNKIFFLSLRCLHLYAFPLRICTLSPSLSQETVHERECELRLVLSRHSGETPRESPTTSSPHPLSFWILHCGEYPECLRDFRELQNVAHWCIHSETDILPPL